MKSVLWVGNSFFYRNNSMHAYVRDLLKSVGKTGSPGCRGTSATISGSGLNWHDIEAYLKPGRVGSYSFVAGNEVRFNTLDKPFDAVMMMDCSQCPIHPKLLRHGMLHGDVMKVTGATLAENLAGVPTLEELGPQDVVFPAGRPIAAHYGCVL